MNQQSILILPYGYRVEHHDGNWFLRKRIRKEYFFRKTKSWAIDKEVFDSFKDQIIGVEYRLEDGTKFFSLVETILSKSQVDDLGYGEQYFLNIRFWEKSDGETTQLELFGE